ncbi:hypothetical protein [Niveispirillum sp.]|uniref:hypothetical protein n=1 Tax=Niveispirillum sp. TaxID=1917217 RepID=UPI001B78598C|nr:hypothetical protein [Niveispirillum sp.]MBP7340425.1 hypothetical protein [Niveispirillum sp.]
MVCVIRAFVGLALLAIPPIAVPLAQASATVVSDEESCTETAAGRCDFTAGSEGVHRIRLALAKTQPQNISQLSISGQQCPLSRETAADGTVTLSCFAYLSGGMVYQLSIPAQAQVSIAKANAAQGQSVTLIP